MHLRKAILAAAVSLGPASGAIAAPVVYEDTLEPGTILTDAIPVAGTFDDPSSDVSDYFSFSGRAGQVFSIVVWRVEEAFDPALWIFEGTFADDTAFAGGSDPGLDPLDPGFLAFGDDELPVPAGPFGDPMVWARLTLPGNGSYTAIVTNFNSDADDGDGVFPYRISLTAVPVPAGLPLLAMGLGAFALVRRRSRRQHPPR